jgi:phosphoribosylformylglycinamidine cyclo-ligase
MSSHMSITYQQAGVDIASGNELVSRIKKIAPTTHTSGVLGGIGGFGALFELPVHAYKNPILVSTTDGVGTKLKLALALECYHSIGIDLVAMCVNDLVVCGAKPLFFLDYYATGRLDVDVAEQIIQSIANGCLQSGCALIGGETAEMPGIYQEKDFDLAGFSVGIVEKNQMIDGRQVSSGDVMIGLASSGIHSNGYSLVRRILDTHAISLNTLLEDRTLGDILITPTRIYVESLLALYAKVNVHAAAHITGGGLIENIPRVLPAFTQAVIDKNTWKLPSIFQWLQTHSQISDHELFKTFNCGIGFVVIIAPEDVAHTLEILMQMGETAWVIGEIEKSLAQEARVVI